MAQMTRGQKMKLADSGAGMQLRVGLGAQGAGLKFDISCFGVDASDKLSDDRYFVFFNQNASPEGALRLAGSGGEDTQSFDVDLTRLPAAIRKLVFVITVDGAGTMKQLQSGHFRVSSNGVEALRFNFSGADFSGETAIIAGEVYLKDVWRVSAVGQGFNGGLSALLKHFGGEEIQGSAAPPTPQSRPPLPPSAGSGYPPQPSAPYPPQGAPYPPQGPPNAGPPYPPQGQPSNNPFGGPGFGPPQGAPYPPPGQPPQNAPYPPQNAPYPPQGQPPLGAATGGAPVNLGKVTLEKRGEKSAVSLRKGGGVQAIHVNLNWDAPAKKGLLAAFQSAPDLDLGCMFRLKTGEAGVIQSLGNTFGARDRPPYIFLDKDDRSGAASDGENLYIFRPDLIDLVLIFAFIYQGASDFGSVGGRMSVKDPEGREIFMRLNSPERCRNFCGIASIRPVGSSIEITKEELYFPSHREADQRFGFGFRWAAGSK